MCVFFCIIIYKCDTFRRCPKFLSYNKHVLSCLLLHNYIQVRSFRLHAMKFCILQGGQKAGGDRAAPISIYIYIYICVYVHSRSIGHGRSFTRASLLIVSSVCGGRLMPLHVASVIVKRCVWQIPLRVLLRPCTYG